jgi:hypothetical protein
VEGLDCTEGLTRAIYTRYADIAELEAQFDSIISALNLPLRAGGCRAGIPSQDVWHYTHSESRPEGRLACFTLPPDVPVIVVTQPEQRLIAMVISNPAVGWQDHFQAWSQRVPNPPPDRQRPAKTPNVLAP